VDPDFSVGILSSMGGGKNRMSEEEEEIENFPKTSR